MGTGQFTDESSTTIHRHDDVQIALKMVDHDFMQCHQRGYGLGHEFCNSESLSMIEAAFPDIIEKVQNQEEDDFPEEEEGEGDESSPSDAETVGVVA